MNDILSKRLFEMAERVDNIADNVREAETPEQVYYELVKDDYTHSQFRAVMKMVDVTYHDLEKITGHCSQTINGSSLGMGAERHSDDAMEYMGRILYGIE